MDYLGPIGIVVAILAAVFGLTAHGRNVLSSAAGNKPGKAAKPRAIEKAIVAGEKVADVARVAIEAEVVKKIEVINNAARANKLADQVNARRRRGP